MNKSVLELLKNTLPTDVLSELLELEQNINKSKNSEKLNQLVQNFLNLKIFRIYNSPQQIQNQEKLHDSKTEVMSGSKYSRPTLEPDSFEKDKEKLKAN